jgi:hypothetical protein
MEGSKIFLSWLPEKMAAWKRRLPILVATLAIAVLGIAFTVGLQRADSILHRIRSGTRSPHTRR